MKLAEKDNLYCFYEDHWLKNLIDSTLQTDKTFSFCEPCLLEMLHAKVVSYVR